MILQIDNVETNILPETGKEEALLREVLVHEVKQYLPNRKQAWKFQGEGVYIKGNYIYRPIKLVSRSGMIRTGLLRADEQNGDPVLAFQQLWKRIPEYQVRIRDARSSIPQLLPKEKRDYTLLQNGKPIELYDYQRQAIECLYEPMDVAGRPLCFPRGIWNCATNAGKTYMCAGMMQNIEGFIEGKARALFLVHRKEIAIQTYQFFREIWGDKVAMIMSGRDTYFSPFANVVVGLYKSVLRYFDCNPPLRTERADKIRAYVRTAQMLFVDECHYAGAHGYQDVIKECQAPIRVFMSGTPYDVKDTANRMRIQGSSGGIVYNIRNEELIDMGISSHMELYMIKNVLNGGGYYNPEDYREEKQKLNSCKYRAESVYQIIKSYSHKRILVCFEHVKHGQFNYEHVQKRCKEEGQAIDMDFTHSKATNRQAKLESFKKGRISVLFTSGILREGVNIPNLEVVILAQGGRSPISIKQFIGRGLRKQDKPDVVRVFDFYDAGRWIENQSKERTKTYMAEGFDVKQITQEQISSLTGTISQGGLF